jgi:hypothetical protein
MPDYAPFGVFFKVVKIPAADGKNPLDLHTPAALVL